ncbi:hypothetical protein HYC85_005798 [Camellia sinensis]|uniref:Methyltransferase n=1 Tax=Camellia sinensis TaxID=4442 RepID=A0A7J7I0I1_CAMSI|nr:hypothetical protein HYC85_005798 [Camellia sinensis]
MLPLRIAGDFVFHATNKHGVSHKNCPLCCETRQSEIAETTLAQSMKEEYGLFVWPCSVVLAEYVWQQMSCFSGVSVIKLGAGTSLPGLVAAKVGLDVTLTAESNKPEIQNRDRSPNCSS